MNTRATDREVEPIAEGDPIGDHFRVVRKLGAGGMGAVYLAENVALPDIRCAVKVLRSELMQDERSWERLRHEANTQSRLKHDNIVQIQDFFPWQQHYCLSLAYVEGGTLADLIEAEPKGLAESRALTLMRGILQGVNHAHEHGVLHCDIKPANVLVEEGGRPRVTDFGIARDVAGGANDRGLVVGTPEYMSPEQIETPDQVDHRSDVFSAGVVLFEMLTGQLPFSPPGEAESPRYPQLTREPTDVRTYRKEISPSLARIVTTALQRDRAARFQGCMEFDQAIVRYRWRRTWLPTIAIASAVAITGSVGGYQWKLAVEQDAVKERLEAERQVQEAHQREEAARKASQERARSAIGAQIATAITQLDSLCRETVRLEQRQKALTTASEAGFPDLVAQFRRQVGEIRQNRSDYARAYLEAINQLGTFDRGLVAEMFKAQPPSDNGSSHLFAAVSRDHAALVAQRGTRAEADLLSSCPR